ncbi:hypothetical protein EVAR_853_1 [Eumeta japonica]|uniref:Uncharacterized protein n=1 Tax=Eumeta variegata TaxID=151549 RepID=A0A4C1SGJ3_EUMVA|nr:hypothetical protein EVAR_853_1 [Eumeta japonica]
MFMPKLIEIRLAVGCPYPQKDAHDIVEDLNVWLEPPFLPTTDREKTHYAPSFGAGDGGGRESREWERESSLTPQLRENNKNEGHKNTRRFVEVVSVPVGRRFRGSPQSLQRICEAAFAFGRI